MDLKLCKFCPHHERAGRGFVLCSHGEGLTMRQSWPREMGAREVLPCPMRDE